MLHSTLRTGLVAAIVVLATASAGHCAPCTAESVGVDTTVASFAEYENLGSAMGETFVARDTLISSITFWRPASEYYSTAGFKLYVVGTDALGQPNTSDMILNGPVAYNDYGDSVHATPFRFEFDPPLALPRAGTYEAAIQAYPCSGVIKYLRTVDDEYPDGKVWSHSQISPCSLRSGPGAVPSVDLFFRIVFCQAPTSSRQATWGEVKSIYH